MSDNSTLQDDLRQLRQPLSKLIEPDFGLLDELLASEVLTRRQCSHIRTLGTRYTQNDQLLDIIVDKPAGSHELFLKALEESNQRHIVNYITFNGGKHSVYFNLSVMMMKVVYCDK